jgi:hypothetical protein
MCQLGLGDSTRLHTSAGLVTCGFPRRLILLARLWTREHHRAIDHEFDSISVSLVSVKEPLEGPPERHVVRLRDVTIKSELQWHRQFLGRVLDQLNNSIALTEHVALMLPSNSSVVLSAIISSASAYSSADSPRGQKICFSLDPPRPSPLWGTQRMQDR